MLGLGWSLPQVTLSFLVSSQGGVKYFGCCVVAIGLYVIVGIPLAWLPSNNPRYGKRTVAVGLQVIIGNLAGIPAPFVGFQDIQTYERLLISLQLYSSKDGPRFIVGYSVSVAMILMAMVLFLTMGLWFRYANERRASGDDDHLVEGMIDEEIAELGENNPEYGYTW